MAAAHGSENYWTRRRSRRALLRGLAGSAGVTALLLAGCGRTTFGGGAKAPASSGGTAPNQLIGRTGSRPSGQPVMGGTLLTAVGGNPPTLDPHRASSGATADANSPVLSRLLRYKPDWTVQGANDGNVEPDLALSAESPDAITWTVKLRPGVKFQNIAPVNGHAVETEDIKQTFLRALDPANPNHGSLDMIDGTQIQTPAADTVVFKLRYPYAPLNRTLASATYSWILPREAVAGTFDPAKKIIGSGPFILDSYTPDVALQFRKNPDWFESGKPYVDGVKVAIVPSAAQQLAQFTAGNIDALGNISQDDLPSVRAQNPKAELITSWGPGDGQIYFNLGDPSSKFRDIRLRQAISLAIDRNALAKIAFDNACIPTFYAPQGLGKWSLKMEQLPSDTAQWYKQDLPRARQLLKDAGADTMSVKMLSPTPYPPSGEAPSFHAMREAIYNMLQALGWQISLTTIDYNKDWVGGGKGVRYGNMSPDSFVFAGLEGRSEIDEYIYGWYDSKSSTNLSHLKDDALDAMIDHARTIVNEDARVKAYIDTQLYMARQMFSVAGNPNGLSYLLVAPRVQNYLNVSAHSGGTSTWSNLWLQKS
jgi:peptide/nickel transport system substrate-binding protein